MARHRARGAPKHHAPWHIGGSTPQLAVDEVRAAAEKQADWHADNAHIGQREKRDLRDFRRNNAANNHTHESTMETHAALVERENFLGMLQVVPIAVYEHIAQTAAKNHAENHAEDHREKGIVVNADLPTLGKLGDNEKGANEAGDVSQSIPTNLQRPQRKRHGVNCMIDIVERHRGSPSKNSPRAKAGRDCVHLRAMPRYSQQ